MGVRAKEDGKSESRFVMMRIGVALRACFRSPRSALIAYRDEQPTLPERPDRPRMGVYPTPLLIVGAHDLVDNVLAVLLSEELARLV